MKHPPPQGKTEVEPILKAIVRMAARLCDASYAHLHLVEGTGLRNVAKHGALSRSLPIGESLPLTRGSVAGRAVADRRTVHVRDLKVAARSQYKDVAALQRAAGLRTMLATPLLQDGQAIGALVVLRTTVRPFTAHQIALLKAFAEQAAIALENARLSRELAASNRELSEALAQQTATGEILGVISSSPTHIQPVLDAVARSAAQFCGAYDASIFLREGDGLLVAAHHGPIPAPVLMIPMVRGSVGGRCALERRPVQVADLQAETEEFPEGSAFARECGHRATLSVPLLREGEVTGVIQLRRLEAELFTDRQIALLQTFADQAVIAIENVRLFTELGARNADLSESLEQQTATSEILRVISQSPSSVQPVFDVIAQNAVRLCEGRFCAVFDFDGALVHLVAQHGVAEEGMEVWRREFPASPGPDTAIGRAILSGRIAHIPDVEEDGELVSGLLVARHLRYRAVVAVPMIREGRPIGGIVVARSQPGAFSDARIDLFTTFADQAVIAVENVRLFTELEARNRDLSEALEQQTATSEILQVISSSPTDLQPVFDIIAESTAKLCGAEVGVVTRFDGEWVALEAVYGSSPEGADALRRVFPMRPTGAAAAVRAVRDSAIAHIPDVLDDEEYGIQVAAVAAGFRAALAVPLLREGRAIGSLGIGRSEAGEFSERQIKLLSTFADQALIAIENVRLFTELEARNRDLTEALDQQTATGEILRVISQSPTNVQPVFDAIARNARRLCATDSATVLMLDGTLIHLAAVDTEHAEGADALRRAYPSPAGRESAGGRAILTGQAVLIPDVREDPEYRFAGMTEAGLRSLMSVPLLRHGTAIGAIVVQTWATPGPFGDKQVELLQTFADQAVIAVENARLFKELEARNHDLTEALDQQTSTSEILRVISQSQTDVQPVFDTIAHSSVRLCDGLYSGVYQRDGDLIRMVAQHQMPPQALEEFRRLYPMPLAEARGPVGRAIHTTATIHIADVFDDPTIPPEALQIARTLGYRTQLVVPMVHQGTCIGAISIVRAEVRSFSESIIALIQTFADQAVIAIENARLLKELQARTIDLTRSVGQLTALGEISRAVSSTLDVETVLTTVVSRASQLAGADGCAIYEYDEASASFHIRATHNLDPVLVATLRAAPLHKGEGAMGRAAETREPSQVADIAVAGAYQSHIRDTLLGAGYRALLSVPLLREGEIIGSLSLNRKAPGEFAPEAVEVLKTFATQSALAIQNARLFREIADKSRQLEAASRHKSEFLANMSHELRTPLNAIIGFSEVLNERMFGELNDKQAEYLRDIHASGTHLLSLINDILDLSKIEAGRMELELSEFHLPSAIESALTLVRERATRRGIILRAAVDGQVGEVEADERKVRQVLLNLLSNAIKFTPEGGRIEVKAALADGGVEVSVHDTGVGIAPEDQEAVFEEFRQVGANAAKREGTGLGLALCRKFIGLHSGRIWVTSEVGVGSAFTFCLPSSPPPGERAG